MSDTNPFRNDYTTKPCTKQSQGWSICSEWPSTYPRESHGFRLRSSLEVSMHCPREASLAKLSRSTDMCDRGKLFMIIHEYLERSLTTYTVYGSYHWCLWIWIDQIAESHCNAEVVEMNESTDQIVWWYLRSFRIGITSVASLWCFTRRLLGGC